MTNKGKGWRLATVAAALMMTGSAWATEYAASFKNADIEEFINTVGKNLNKTIIDRALGARQDQTSAATTCSMRISTTNSS